MHWHSRFLLLAAGAILIPFAAAAATTDVVYAWKGGDLFRFDYLKTVTLVQPDESGKAEERKTELAAVLILEIKNSTPGGPASGTLRFDSPRITLPVLTTFSSQVDAPEIQADKNRAIARAMEGAIKTARWSVNLGADGSMQIASRTPASLGDWLKETSSTAGWRKMKVEQLRNLIEQDLGLKVQSTDREIFLCNTAAKSAPAETGEALHPLRTGFVPAAKLNGKVQIGFKREFAGKGNTEFAVPNLASPQAVTAAPQSVSTRESAAIFDTKMGMLDSLSEDYSVKMKYKCGTETIDQDVRVQYKLRRLAPAIARVD